MADQNPDYIKKFIDHLGNSLLDDLKQSIPEHLAKLVDIRFKGIKDGLEPLKGIESKLLDQANDIENLQISYDHLSKEFESYRKKNQSLPEVVKDAVTESVGTKMDEKKDELLDAMNVQLENTPTKPARPAKKSRFNWKFWLKGGKK